MFKYLGSKRLLIPWIVSVVETVRGAGPCQSAADLFCGTSRVAVALKGIGLETTANDMSRYAHTVARALVEADARVYTPDRLQPYLDELNAVPGVDGWFTETYARRSRFFTEANAARIEAVRTVIDRVAGADGLLRDILLTALILAADRVDSTTGVQMAYLKQYAARAKTPLTLRLPPMTPGVGHALCLDATEAAHAVRTDLVYLDPPYNQHSYLGNYHLWETLVLNDRPDVYGVAQKRVDTRQRRSPYNSRRAALAALVELLGSIDARHLVLSFSDEGYIGLDDLREAVATWGPSVTLARGHQRYIGASIGIHNPQGQKVGTVSHTRNTEYLFVASRDAAVLRALRRRHKAEIV